MFNQFGFIDQDYIQKKLFSPLLLVLAIVIFNSQVLIAQSEASIPKMQINMVGDNVQISYTLDAKKKYTYRVWLEIVDSLGNEIPATALSGDIGKGVLSGKNKTILWNLEADSMILSENLFFEIKAESENIPEEIIKPVEREKAELNSSDHRSTWKTMLVLGLYPGLGSMIQKKKTSYLLLGVGGYATLTTSYIYYTRAINSYSVYQRDNEADVSRNDLLYTQAKQEANYARLFGVAAIAFWATDLILILSRTQRSGKLAKESHTDNVGLNVYYDLPTNSTLLGLQIRF